MSAVPQADIAALTDPAGIETFDDARTRIAELRDLLTRSDDYRGTFVLAFDEILELTGPTLDSGIYAIRNGRPRSPSKWCVSTWRICTST
ncbi:hypothetical protein ACLBYD_11315 [Rhodococcus sp. C26F]